MSGAKYNAFVRQRNAFFIGKCKSGPSGKKNKTSGLNSVDLKFMTWLGFSKARIKHLAVKVRNNSLSPNKNFLFLSVTLIHSGK